MFLLLLPDYAYAGYRVPKTNRKFEGTNMATKICASSRQIAKH